MIKNGKIIILENIQVDKTLPKHVKVEEIKNNTVTGGVLSDEIGFSIPFSDNINVDFQLEHLRYLKNERNKFGDKLKYFIYKKMFASTFNIKFNNNKTSSVLELKNFFDGIKSSVTKLDYKNINEILSKYESILSAAENNKQVALIERLNDYSEVLKNELILSTSEFNKFLDEKDVVKFYETASKHEKYNTFLCLTYIKNFVKIIPAEISELKQKADKLKVFDNYVILHYDYNGTAVDDTKAEKQKKKDPILFGVIKNSKRLYYIGDWIDEYCDLTLDVLIKTIGISEKKLDETTIIDGFK